MPQIGEPPVSGMTEDELKVALMKADLFLKTRQGWWETPRSLALIVGVAAAVAGVAGFKLGSQPPQSIVVQFQQPLGVKLLP
jgi:hypothetical protein